MAAPLALPWGSGAGASSPSLPGGDVAIKIVKFSTGRGSLLSSFLPAPTFSADDAGVVCGPPGAAYQLSLIHI